jgi:hypothetical protein
METDWYCPKQVSLLSHFILRPEILVIHPNERTMQRLLDLRVVINLVRGLGFWKAALMI